MTISEALEREEGSVTRAWTNARYSKLGWTFDLESRLNEITMPLITQSRLSEHSYHVESGIKEFHFQITAHTNRIYPSNPVKDCDRGETSEEPACLVYSLRHDGSILVIIFPHKSSWKTYGRDTHYIIGYYETSNDLAGFAGDSVLRGHLKLFLRVISLSSAITIPTRSSSRLLEQLELETDRYSKIYDSKNEQRRALKEAELGLGAGLTAGLIASTLFPMLQLIGKEASESAKSIESECKAANIQNYTLCLSNNNYQGKLKVSSAFATENILIVAFAITLLAVIMMRKLYKLR